MRVSRISLMDIDPKLSRPLLFMGGGWGRFFIHFIATTLLECATKNNIFTWNKNNTLERKTYLLYTFSNYQRISWDLAFDFHQSSFLISKSSIHCLLSWGTAASIHPSENWRKSWISSWADAFFKSSDRSPSFPIFLQNLKFFLYFWNLNIAWYKNNNTSCKVME